MTIQQRVYLVLLAGLLLFGLPLTVSAQNALSDTKINVQLSKNSAALEAAQWVEFDTVVRNDGSTATPPLTVHLSITALSAGKYLDPEDWSPKRTQYLEPLQPGKSGRLTWKINALFEGSFASFVTVLSAEKSLPLVVSKPLRFEVAPDNFLRLEYVIPVVAVVPFVPLALLIFSVTHMWRRRSR